MTRGLEGRLGLPEDRVCLDDWPSRERVGLGLARKLGSLKERQGGLEGRWELSDGRGRLDPLLCSGGLAGGRGRLDPLLCSGGLAGGRGGLGGRPSGPGLGLEGSRGGRGGRSLTTLV